MTQNELSRGGVRISVETDTVGAKPQPTKLIGGSRLNRLVIDESGAGSEYAAMELDAQDDSVRRVTSAKTSKDSIAIHAAGEFAEVHVGEGEVGHDWLHSFVDRS